VASIKDLVAQLTLLPVTVLNSHTHFDHTGGNFEFSEILNEDIAYSRKNAQGQSKIYSRDALAPERICGKLPSGVRADSYAIVRGTSRERFAMAIASISADASSKSSSRPVTHLTL
jgi:glyoxylase-like metal-dependent hydrolase (beta-lactamase superfamily II)